MDFLKSFRRVSAVQRMAEESMYLLVVEELSAGIRREGLWAKALVEAGGDEAAAKANYLKLRVQAIRDEGVIEQAAAEEAREHAAAEASRVAQSTLDNLVASLGIAGYVATKFFSGWKIKEPDGGVVFIDSDNDLFEYAKRGCKKEVHPVQPLSFEESKKYARRLRKAGMENVEIRELLLSRGVSKDEADQLLQ